MSTTFYRGENPLHADKLNTAFSERVSRGGDTMQGFLKLAADPVQPFDAATKQYVDRFTAMGVPTGAYIGASPPGNTLAPLWWDNVSGQLFIQYNDGSSTQWVSANSTYSTQLPLAGGVLTGPLYWTATGSTTSRSAQDRAADWINVSDHGAVYDGTTGNLAAFNAARGAAVTNEIIRVPGNKLFLSTPPTAGPTGAVLWQFNGTTSGTGSTPITGMGTDVVESFIGSKYFNRAHTLSPIPPVVRIDLTQDHSGGTSAQTTTALQINVNSSGTSGEGLLGITSTLNCSKTAGGAQVALIGYTNRLSGSANVPMFGANCYAQDQTGLPSGSTGSLVGTELAAIANDIDNGGSGALYAPDGEGIRAVLTCYAAKFNPAGADAVVGYGVSVAPHAGASFRRMFAALGPFNKAAFTTEFAIQNAGANAIWLGDNHTIALNKAGTSQLGYTTTGTPRLSYMAGANEVWSVSDAGAWSGTGIGWAIGNIPGPIVNQSGIAALHPPAELIFQRASFAATDGQDFHFRRATAFTGGTSANINKTVLVDTGIGANDTTSNWGLTSKISTASTSATAVGLAAYLQTWRSAGGKSQCWGAVVEMSDFTGLKSSLVVGPTNSMEIDLGTTDIDDATNPSKWGGIGNRHIIHFVVARNQGTLLNEVSHGLWFGTNGSYIDSLIGADLGPGAAGAMVRQIIDARGFIPPTGVTDPVAAVRMSAGQIIDLNGGPALSSAPGSYLQYRTATSRLYYVVGGVDQWSIDASGNVRARGTVTPNTTP